MLTMNVHVGVLFDDDKNNIRWELAEISNKLNKLLKNAVMNGPGNLRLSTDMQIHELRSRRDMLLNKLQNINE